MDRLLNGMATLAERLSAPMPEATPAKYKGENCASRASVKNPGSHPYCLDSRCDCTCHSLIERQAKDPAAISIGLYTVGDDEVRHTIRVSDAKWAKNLPDDARTVSYLAGSDNERDYVSFGFLLGRQYRPFKKFSGNIELRRAVVAVTDDPATAGLAYALESGRCYRCNRTLTVPTSIHRGLGPDCATMV